MANYLDKTGLQYFWNKIKNTFALKSHTHDDRYYTESEVNTKLNNKINYNATLFTTNPFTDAIYKGLYISKIDNAFYCLDKRFNVSVMNNGVSVGTSNLFDGSYETQVIVRPDTSAIISCDFTGSSGTSSFPGYPYGYIYVSFYNRTLPKTITGRVYCNYASQGIGWHDITFTKYAGDSYRAKNNYYALQHLEITIEGQQAVSGYNGSYIVQVEMHLDRPSPARNPFVSKYGAETLYYNLTAPKFIGALQGNADTATNATKVNNHTVNADVPSGAKFTDTIVTKTSELTNDSGYITAASLPTKTSDLTNDSAFIAGNKTDNTKGVKFFAHRGLTNNSTENTLNAFIEAYNKGYRSFETDVRVTKDNIPILNHNATLGGYTIASTNYSVLASAATSAGFTLAKLEDYLKLANVLKFDNTVLELKTENTVANCTSIATLVKQYQMSERIIFNVKGVTANANAVRAVIPNAMLLTHYDSATTLSTFSTYKVNGKVIFSILPSEIGSTITQSAMYNLMSDGYGVYLVPSTTAELTNMINIGSQYIEIGDGYKNTLELDEFVSDATGCISPFKYKSGETFVIGQQMCAGQLTSSGRNIYFTITCPKQIPSGLSVALSGAVNIRHPEGNLAAGQEINSIGTLSTPNISGNMIYVQINLATASSLTNNRPLTVQLGAGFTISFS